ncbi:hypothetical protein D6827_00490 [Candidatus Parcubacteria bacterium]|nr:MAG: hypothetical protein D6827_00490 [Candidatus Parcubacteria bacterium]
MYLGSFAVFAVLVWGMLEVWISNKQTRYWSSLEWDLLAINIPKDAVNSPKGMENFFNNLAGSKSSITRKEKWFLGKFQSYFTFEIVSNGGKIQFYIRCISKYRDLVEAALYAQYPEAQIVKVDDYVDVLPDDYPNDEYDLFGSELSLSKKSIFPLKTYEMFEHQGEKDLRFKDPLLPLLEMMGKMRPGEHYWIQLLIMSPDSQDWRKEGKKYIANAYGKEEQKNKSWFDETIGWLPKGVLEQAAGVTFGNGEQESLGDDFRMFKITPDEKDLLEAIKAKAGQIGWYAKIRIVYGAKKEVFRKGTIASMTKGVFNQFDSGWNKLSLTHSSTPKDDYFWQAWQMPAKQRTLIRKYKNRSFGAGVTPYILSSSELATLFHFPSAEARTPVLTTLNSRVAEAPPELNLGSDSDDDILPQFHFVKSQRQVENFDEAESTQDDEKDDYYRVAPVKIPRFTPPTAGVNNSTKIQSQEKIRNHKIQKIEQEVKPRPGMPAPLPPGLDLSDESIEDNNTPSNLPI